MDNLNLEVKHSDAQPEIHSNAQDVTVGLGYFAFGMFQRLDRQPDPINNTIWTFRQEDGFEADEDLGPNDDDDDEATTEAIFARIGPNILLYGIREEPRHACVLEPPTTLADPLDGMWTGYILLPDGTAPEGRLSMVLTRTTDKLAGVAENFLGVINLAGTLEGGVGEYDSGTDTITGLWEQKTEDPKERGEVKVTPLSPAASVGGTEEGGALDVENTSGAVAKNEDQAPHGATNDSQSSTTTNLQRFVFRRLLHPATPRPDSPEIELARDAERKRFVDLVKRQLVFWRNLSTPWKPLSDEENAELLRLKTELRSSDARFYTSLASFEIHQLVNHERLCDSCTRVICGDTPPPLLLGYDFVHMRSHLLVKTFQRIHDGEMGWLIPTIKDVAKRVKGRSKAAQTPPQASTHATTSKSQVQQPRCCCCDKPVSSFLAEDTCICMDCTSKDATAKPDGVNPEHRLSDPLVQIFDGEEIPEQLRVTDVTPMELKTRIVALETKMETLMQLNPRITALETKIETLLEAVLQRREVVVEVDESKSVGN
ncbi:hypothetical protein C8R44DRAFT_890026 [Mycena epipterygia]|nr:hypothetical protein C8R44DRAFT_890026 [Mycena epipterygia]